MTGPSLAVVEAGLGLLCGAGHAAAYEDMLEWWCDVMIAHAESVS